MAKELDFTQGKILSPLMRFAMPVLAALFLQAMYGAVDLLIVGKFALTADISAVATGSQVMHALTGLLVGLATGITIMVGQKIGENKPVEAGQFIGSGMALFAVVALVFTGLFVGFAMPVANLMQAPEGAEAATAAYVRICSAGTVFIIGFNVLGSIFRAIGDAKMPLITVAIACVTNIFGDLLLVAVFHMGAAGAALATVGAQAVSVVLSLVIIRRRTLPFVFERSYIRFDGAKIGRIFKLGLPIAMQDLLVSISFLVIMGIVNTLGLVPSAGVGVAQKLCAFVMLVPAAYSQSMSAFVAQNTGAGKPERANRALWCGIGTSLICGVVIAYLAYFHGDKLSWIFAKDPEVIAASASYLRAYAIDCLLVSFLFCLIGYFSGRGNTLFVMLQGLIGAFGVRIPVSYLVSRIAGVELFYIGLATPASTAVQIALCLGFYVIVNWRQRREMRLRTA